MQVMKRLIILVPLVFVISCAAPPSKSPPTPPVAPTSKPLGSLEGTWREMRNQRQPVRVKKTWSFDGDRITIVDGDKVYSGTFRLIEDADPKGIDFVFEGFPVNAGIYFLKGNVLTMKLLDTAMDRPAKHGPEAGYRVIVCRREKPAPPRGKKESDPTGRSGPAE